MAKVNVAKNKKPLTKEQRSVKLFFLIYTLILIAIFNVKIINNFVYAFRMLFGKVNYWFVFTEDGTVVNLPKENDTTTPLPTFPKPDIKIPITTWGYWREVGNAIIRGVILIFIAIALIWLFIYLLKRLEIRNKKQTTLLYLFYTKTIKKPLNTFFERVDRFIASIMRVILDKRNLTLMILIALAISGKLIVYITALTVSVYSLLITGPVNWIWLHFTAIIYYLVLFISKFTAFNLAITLILIYNFIAFVFAYKEFRKNELAQEEFVDNMSYGVGMAGGMGKGKTLIGKTLADASQRSAKKYVRKELKDIENVFSGVVEFSDLRRFFDKNKDNINDEIEAEQFANDFINKYEINDKHIDRFLGKTPNVHEQIKWYFIGLWVLKKETKLVQSPIPMIINDPSSSNEIRNTIFDILTMRYEDVYALKLDQNLIKSSLDNIESDIDAKGNRVFKLKSGVNHEEINLSAHPGLTVFWPELDKDFPFSDRSKILEAKIDKLLGIFRHFTAFKQRTIGHFIYDSQQYDGVANIVRTKFDSVLKIHRQDKGKRSLFLIPYIKFMERKIKVYTKIKDAMIQNAPYKKSFFRVFIEWRLRRLNRINDYLHSFDYIDLYVTLMDASGAVIDDGGKKVKKLRINLANAYYTYPSVVYQEPYKEAKMRFPVVKSVKNLKSWNSMSMTLDDITDIKSDFLGEVFLGEKISESKRKKNKTKQANDDDWLL